MPITARPDHIRAGIVLGMADDECSKIRQAVSETKPEDKGRQRGLIKLAIDQGCLDAIPDDWEIEVEDDEKEGTS